LLPSVPAIGATVVWALRDRTAARRLAVLAILPLTAALAVVAAIQGSTASWTWGAGLHLQLAAAGFSRVMIILVPTIGGAVMAYVSTGEDLAPRSAARLEAAILGFVAAMELLVLAADLLTLLIGWELVGAFSWLLIGFHWGEAERPRSATVAFLATRVGDLGLYLAAAAALASVGSLEFGALTGAHGVPRHVIAAGIMLAAAAKSAQLPFSPWLFSAMAGPTPVSALLHSATMVAAGAYALVRLAPVGAPLPWYGPMAAALGTATVLLGGTVALLQTDIKRVLAASTSSQYGLMFVAAGVGSTAAAGAHLVTHAFFKSLLFLGAGVAVHASGAGDLRSMRLGRSLPTVAGLFAVGAVALAAVPPLGGAMTKERIVSGAFSASPWLGSLLLVSGVLTAAYAGRLTALAFGAGPARPTRSPGLGELAALSILAVSSISLGLLWLPGGDRVVETLVGSSMARGEAWELGAGLLGVALSTVVVAVSWRRGSLVTLGLTEPMRGRVADWLGLPALYRTMIVRPAMGLSGGLARLDDRAVDAGVRSAARFGMFASRVLSGIAERGIDRRAEGLSRTTLRIARVSGIADERAVDAAVEGVAAWTGRAGSMSRRLQTGLAHHYYVLAGAGLLVMIGVAILWR
jgi:NADH:ubiquinone oxidoreductase subunit 5 (subunit L)/multisubunit Na+/H+ antiporter MnhA subunit